MKTKKKLMLFMATLLTALTVVMPLQTNAAGEEDTTGSYRGGGLQDFVIVETNQKPDTIQLQRKASHATDASSYGAFCCDAIYDNMSSAEKQLYDNMYADCMTYLTTTKTSGDGFTDGASFSGLNEDQMVSIALIFNFLNPQFYFIENQLMRGSDWSGNSYIKWKIYDSFADGNSRAAATASMYAVVDGYMAQINAQGSAYDKLKVAHDLLANNTTYNGDTYDQSCYAPFVRGVSVCAGYAEAYELLCNKAGIPTIAVTSDEHEWNQVYLNNVWYLVDVTWDDGDPGLYYDYFLKSTATVHGYGSDDRSMHTLESLWSPYHVRDCLYDYPAPNGETTQDFSDAQGPIIPGAMYRMFNPSSGEHFYTGSLEEKNQLVASGVWNYEGIAWIAPTSSNTPVYRLYNPASGAHHYTPSADERDQLVNNQGWNYEGIGWYSNDSQTTPMYRLYDPTGTGFAEVRAHHYTASTEERNQLLASGWIDEGIGWYGN